MFFGTFTGIKGNPKLQNRKRQEGEQQVGACFPIEGIGIIIRMLRERFVSATVHVAATDACACCEKERRAEGRVAS